MKEQNLSTMSHALSRALGGVGPWIMGIVNVTPDSFSDGGKNYVPQDAIEYVKKISADSNLIVDLGGESTGPGSVPVGADEELRRLTPVVKATSASAFISVDTYRSQTADVAIQLGAKMINDVSALRADTDMVRVIRMHQPFVVLMYSKQPGSMPHVTADQRYYDDPIIEIGDFLAARIDFAEKNGIRSDRIILDPGMGRFLSEDPEISWQVLARLGELRARFADYPILVGTSRKSFLGGNLGERDPLSQLTALCGALNGAAIIRTHNVDLAADFLKTWKKIYGTFSRSPVCCARDQK